MLAMQCNAVIRIFLMGCAQLDSFSSWVSHFQSLRYLSACPASMSQKGVRTVSKAGGNENPTSEKFELVIEREESRIHDDKKLKHVCFVVELTRGTRKLKEERGKRQRAIYSTSISTNYWSGERIAERAGKR